MHMVGHDYESMQLIPMKPDLAVAQGSQHQPHDLGRCKNTGPDTVRSRMRSIATKAWPELRWMGGKSRLRGRLPGSRKVTNSGCSVASQWGSRRFVVAHREDSVKCGGFLSAVTR